MRHEKGFRTDAQVARRHKQMLSMRRGGYLVKQIGQRLGLDHSTVSHHLRANCHCGLPEYNQSAHQVRIITALRRFGPIRVHALAIILQASSADLAKQLETLSSGGLARKTGLLWAATQ